MARARPFKLKSQMATLWCIVEYSLRKLWQCCQKARGNNRVCRQKSFYSTVGLVVIQCWYWDLRLIQFAYVKITKDLYKYKWWSIHSTDSDTVVGHLMMNLSRSSKLVMPVSVFLWIVYYSNDKNYKQFFITKIVLTLLAYNKYEFSYIKTSKKIN